MLLKLAAIWAFISMSTDVSSLLTNVSDPFLQTFQRFAFEDATLLGAPLFPGPLWNDRCTDQLRAMDRLSLIGSQDALILLRVPLVLLECSIYSVALHRLTTFDDLLRSALNRITNCDISDTQWLQASLPIKDGGLSVRRVASLALPAYIASAVSTQSLQTTILSSRQCASDSYFETYRVHWSTSNGLPPTGKLHVNSQPGTGQVF